MTGQEHRNWEKLLMNHFGVAKPDFWTTIVSSVKMLKQENGASTVSNTGLKHNTKTYGTDQ